METPEIEIYSLSNWPQPGDVTILELEVNSMFSPFKYVKLIATFSPRSS